MRETKTQTTKHFTSPIWNSPSRSNKSKLYHLECKIPVQFTLLQSRPVDPCRGKGRWWMRASHQRPSEPSWCEWDRRDLLGSHKDYLKWGVQMDILNVTLFLDLWFFSLDKLIVVLVCYTLFRKNSPFPCYSTEISHAFH